ncbi:MAG: hypothetical protein WAM89_00040 [Terriglobales bacterium]
MGLLAEGHIFGAEHGLKDSSPGLEVAQVRTQTTGANLGHRQTR